MSLLGRCVIFSLLVLATSSMMNCRIAAAETDLVKSVCQSTSDYAGCVDALSLDPRTDDATDLTTLATIGFDLAVANVTEALDFVMQIMDDGDPSTSPDLMSALDFCIFAYQHAGLSFETASQEVTHRSPLALQTAYYDVITASQWSGRCSQELMSLNFRFPEISKRDDRIRLFCSIGQVIITALISERSP